MAQAQVVINQAALAQLAGIATPVAVPEAPEAHHVVHHVAHHRHQAVARPQVVIAVAKPSRPVPTPAAAKLPAPPPVLHVTPPPSPVALHFAAGSSALPANANAALGPICQHSNGASISIAALAPGQADDPSVAMRLSMDRAFAVRDALAACGIPPAQILPRALGDIKGQDLNAAVVSLNKP